MPPRTRTCYHAPVGHRTEFFHDNYLFCKESIMSYHHIRSKAWQFAAGIIITFSAITVSAQDYPFQSTYGGTESERGTGVIMTPDGGHIAVGTYTDVTTPGITDIYVVKTSACGELEWSQRYDIGSVDIGHRIRRTIDSNYIILGNAEHTTPCNDRLNIVLIKIDPAGAVLWSRSYGGLDGDIGEDLQVGANGEFIIAGTASSFGASSVDMLLMLTDANGFPIWGRTFGTEENEHLLGCAFGLSNGMPIITAVGFRPAGGNHPFEGILIRVDWVTGALLPNFPRAIGSQGFNVIARSVIHCANNDIAIAGYVQALSGDAQAYLLRTNATGMYLNDLALNGTTQFAVEEFAALQERPNGNIIAAGSLTDAPGGFGSMDMYVVEVNPGLMVLNQTLHGGAGYDMGAAIVADGAANRWVIVGTTNSFGLGNEDMYMVRQLANGISGCHDSIARAPQTRPMMPLRQIPVQTGRFRVSCEIEATGQEYGEQHWLCDTCPEDDNATTPPELSSVHSNVRVMEMRGR